MCTGVIKYQSQFTVVPPENSVLIHDHAAQFNLNYIAYGIKGIKTSVKAPNMNTFAERFNGSVRPGSTGLLFAHQ